MVGGCHCFSVVGGGDYCSVVVVVVVTVFRGVIAIFLESTACALSQRFRELLADSPAYAVPAAVPELSTEFVLTSTWYALTWHTFIYNLNDRLLFVYNRHVLSVYVIEIIQEQ